MLAEAQESALIHRNRSGMPDNPQGRLPQVVRRKAIGRIRRHVRRCHRAPDLAMLAEADEAAKPAPGIPDERLGSIPLGVTGKRVGRSAFAGDTAKKGRAKARPSPTGR